MLERGTYYGGSENRITRGLRKRKREEEEGALMNESRWGRAKTG